MSYFFHHPHKAGNLKFWRPVVSFHRGEEPKKKEDWLDSVSGWPTSFRDGLARDSMKNNGSKAELFGSVQVYLEDLLKVVIHQGRKLASNFLNT